MTGESEALGALPEMTGPRLHLRAPCDADATARMALGYDPTILRAYGAEVADQASYTEARAQSWLAEQRQAMAWMITIDGRLLGTVRLHSHVQADRRAQIAIGLLDSANLGHGYGTEAMRLVLDHAFDGMGLNRVSLRVLADNARAIRCYTRLGFVTEGRERQSARVPGGWQDDLIMGLLASEWSAQGDA
ncbi:GNAT family N-acetyltransferase [Jannaschia pohangensis]|uniref:Protein N-acetyltransferase, RimJ/RimL family n=1 Tax=Jannaschia pohangensis TaxID=390807 RepID=A0A1I3GY59_9RHOB|nr:GNAT family protein [Jannaschia pohangensis]SFI28321.1 Protein N-acetyltransferase, RimJ/RimL family [Jannaschia pohangensis]